MGVKSKVYAPKSLKGKGPEHAIQQNLIKFLSVRDWVVMVTHGNMFQRGFPDLYALHHIHGSRWIEVKNLQAFAFTPAQLKYFPIIAASGEGIWVLTAATLAEYQKLFKKPNWHTFLYSPKTRQEKTRKKS